MNIDDYLPVKIKYIIDNSNKRCLLYVNQNLYDKHNWKNIRDYIRSEGYECIFMLSYASN